MLLGCSAFTRTKNNNVPLVPEEEVESLSGDLYNLSIFLVNLGLEKFYSLNIKLWYSFVINMNKKVTNIIFTKHTCK